MISILLPIYNGEKFLKYSIESVLNQTSQEFGCTFGRKLLALDKNHKEIIS
jgi:glycosyltransferase involved in cell wall biosynthesis